jgi:outer membrane receptor protein involved in Fe transport
MKICYTLLFFFLFVLLPAAGISQPRTISGTVVNNATNAPVNLVSIAIKDSSGNIVTDKNGAFNIQIDHQFPVTLVFKATDFDSKEVVVTAVADTILTVALTPSALSPIVEIVVSANRVSERILESPVSIERLNPAAISNTPAVNYYDMLGSLKGVDVVTSSLLFKTISTRGFNKSGNPRVNQLVDGMDNQAPGLNFSIGAIVGPTELDVDNIELLHGASSALYGSGGMNGTLLITGKNPFRNKGISVLAKSGVSHIDKKKTGKPEPYYDFSMRWAEVISPKLAMKISGQFVQGADWAADDYRNYQSGNVALNQYGNVKNGDRLLDPNFDGVNIYGDETSFDLKKLNNINVLGIVATGIKQQINTAFAAAPSLAALGAGFVDSVINSYNGAPLLVSRTGYKERDVINGKALSVKLTGGLYYKLTDKIEVSFLAHYGTGNTVFTGSDRYFLKGTKIGQYKLEFKAPNWSIKGYTNQESAGESYNATVTTQLFNEAWKSSSTWYPQYTQQFLLSKINPYVGYLKNVAAGLINPATTPFTGFVTDVTAHQSARDTSDLGRPVAGSAQFNTLFDRVRKTPIPNGGLLFDRTDLWSVDGIYNFTGKIKYINVLIGANFKQYRLNSEGTLFPDTAGIITINEVGAFTQISSKLFNDALKLSASGRYDKNENFAGRVTPRFTAVLTFAKTHNLRLSYQTAYRFPTTQNQWINLAIGGGIRLLGGLESLRNYYKFNTNPVYTLESFSAAVGNNPPASVNPALLKKAEFPEYKAESLESYELGYRGLFSNSVLIDVYGYYGIYSNFLGRAIFVQSANGTPAGIFTARNTYSVNVNSAAKVSTSGYGVSIRWTLPKNFILHSNFSQDKINNIPTGFVSFFNVPDYRLNFSFENSGFGKNKSLGFNISVHNQSSFFNESDFRQGQVNGFTTIDGLLSYKLRTIKSIIKLGGSNLSNKYYRNGFGNSNIGGMYYVSFGYNTF